MRISAFDSDVSFVAKGMNIVSKLAHTENGRFCSLIGRNQSVSNANLIWMAAS